MTEAVFSDNFDVSTIHLRGVKVMPSKLKDLRLKAGLTVFELAVAADVSIATVNRLEKDKNSVSRLMAYKVLNVLSEKLGRRIEIEDIEGTDASTKAGTEQG